MWVRVKKLLRSLSTIKVRKKRNFQLIRSLVKDDFESPSRMKAVGDCVHIADFIELEEQLGICRTRSVDTPYRKLRMDWTKFS